MTSPLDETYLTEPGDHYIAGSIPPEEREVRDVMLAATLLRQRLSAFDYWWSQVFKPTKAYSVALENFRRLYQICGKSLEHRAAICRIANSQNIPVPIRHELMNIVIVHDQSKKS